MSRRGWFTAAVAVSVFGGGLALQWRLDRYCWHQVPGERWHAEEWRCVRP